MANKNKIRKAAVRYLEITGHYVLSENYDDFIVFDDEDSTVFAQLGWTIDGKVHEADMSRDRFEHVIAKWFAECDEVIECPIRFDIIHVTVIKDDRAIIRHHVNADLED